MRDKRFGEAVGVRQQATDAGRAPGVRNAASALGMALDAQPAADARDAAGDLEVAKEALDRGTHRIEHCDGTARWSRAQWAELVTESQRVVNTATALQNLAITRLAAIEDDLLDDGSVVESARVPGHVAMDSADVVAGALGVSHSHAEQRVALAVRLAAADDQQPGAGLGGLHAAMAAGALDGYRASVVADELAEAPPEVAAAVVHVLVPYLGHEPPAALRSRCRRALARISPDLLVQRARRARERCGLRRWVEEPGVDRWEGTFPSERAAEGWAVVDGLAQRYVSQGRCITLEAARGEALMDLVRGQATIDVQLVVTVPAEVVADEAAPRGRGDEKRDEPLEPVRVQPENRMLDGGGLADLNSGDRRLDDGGLAEVNSGGRMLDGGGLASTRTTHCTARALAEVNSGGRMHSGGSAVEQVPDCAVRREDAGATRAADPTRRVGEAADPGGGGRGTTATLDRDGDLVEVTGPFPGDPVLVGRAWVISLLCSAGRPPHDRGGGPLRTAPEDRGAGPPGEPWVRMRLEPCHPGTGGLLGVGEPGSLGYRPGRRVTALVRTRDGRCRFPGCSVAARFCDLDHVRPWPGGVTTTANLMCLCRRHHRIKQRPNWRVRLLPDGRAVWTDPTGRVRTSWPRDLLTAVVLRAPAESPVVQHRCGESPRAAAERGTTISAWSAWETLLEVRVEHLPTAVASVPSSCGGIRVPSVSARGLPGPSLRWPTRGRFHYVDDRRGHVRAPVRAARSLSAGSVGGGDPPPF